MQRYHSPSVEFYCRQSKVGKNGQAPIEMGINVNGVRKFVNTPMKATPSEFNRKRRPRELQEYVDNMRMRFNSIICDMLKAGEPLTTSALKEYMQGGGYKPYSVGNMIDEYLALKKKEEKNDEITNGQYKKYVYSGNVLLRYVDKDAPITALTNTVIRNIYIDVKAKFQTATACGYMTRIKAFVKYAIDCGQLKTNPFQGIKITRPTNDIELLSEEDFNKILAFHSDIKRLMKVRDFFIFACGSGLGYKDCSLLTPNDFKMVDGHLCIVKERAKTGKQFVSVLMPCAEYIARKHNFDLSAIRMCNQPLNNYLKTIQDMCNIKSVKSLHFYLGRHYYAHKLLNSGIRAEVVSKALGNTSKILLKHYAKVNDETVVKEVTKVI